MKETILVVGGAGYVGSHMVKRLLEENMQVVTLDNLSTGMQGAVVGGEFVKGAVEDVRLLDELFERKSFAAVMHFASSIEVGESVAHPAKYYKNNFVGALTLLDRMVAHGVKRFVFSSTAAVYGEPQRIPIDEDHPKKPVNPYGKSKWMVEQALQDFDAAYGLRSVSLRYFNAAGADPDGGIGENHDPETHLIPLVLQALAGRRPEIKIFGRDYDTPDGTCLRDYIHVVDLCDAHRLALTYLSSGGQSTAFNLGNGRGFSVQEVIDVARRVTGRNVQVRDGQRRPGDPARLVADSKRATQELGWEPKYADLETIIRHAWKWECARGNPA